MTGNQAMSAELTDDQISKLLQGISIPPQPQIMVDLQMEQLSPDCSINRIADLISQDIGLSGSIIKTVNSSLFGLTNKISSILQACNILGVNSVINIVNALSIRSELSDESIVTLSRFWDSASDVAMACANVAKHIGFQSPDEAYTLGLFHNCGIPLLMKRFEDYSDSLCHAYATEHNRLIDYEDYRYHTNHTVVSYYIAKSWNLPLHICEAISTHHCADKIFADLDYKKAEKKNLLAILKMAEHICNLSNTLGNQDKDHEWLRLEESVLMYVGLSPYDFQTIKESCLESGLGGDGYFAD